LKVAKTRVLELEEKLATKAVNVVVN